MEWVAAPFLSSTHHAFEARYFSLFFFPSLTLTTTSTDVSLDGEGGRVDVRLQDPWWSGGGVWSMEGRVWVGSAGGRGAA